MKAVVAVLIPTLNEEIAISRVIERVPVHALSNDGYDTAIYVIDGGSEDRTQQRALEKGAEVLLVTQPGKGAAMQHAFSSIRADFFIMIDGDGTYPQSKLQILCAFLVHTTS